MFIDELEITVKAGDGGDGCVAFLREKYRPFGGPSGGDGGDGGDVIFEANRHRNTFYGLARRKKYSAERGHDGEGKNMSGKKGKDLLLAVPVGTVIYDAESGENLADLNAENTRWTAARGGSGGRGNQHFATPTVQTPRKFEKGIPGEERILKLELKLIADLGLVGLPNAGKSSLLSRLSAARPRIAGYPFTTKEPVLGIVDCDNFNTVVLADIPGIIEGASHGAGMGLEFLRHVERTRALLYVVDLAPIDGSDPSDAVEVIRTELAEYSQQLAGKPWMIAGNKADMPGARDNYVKLCEKYGEIDCLLLSCATGEGLVQLRYHLFDWLHPAKPEESDGW